MFRLGMPELVIFGLPAFVGFLADKYVGRLANFCIMLATFHLDLFLYASAISGELRLRLLTPIFFIWPPLSAGQFIAPLLFVLLAIVVYRLRYTTN